MKIAIVAASLPEANRKLGGVEVFVHRLANELASSSGDQVTLFSFSDRPGDARYNHQILFPRLRFLRSQKLFIWFVLPWLFNFLDLREFDVVHFNGDDWFYFWRSIPSLRTMHGSALNEARTATSLKRRLMQLLIYPLEHLSARLATITVGVGKDSQEIYHLQHTINNGVNLERFYPGEKSPQPTILYIGTWEGRKRGQFMFECFTQQILPAMPTAQLWMVSDQCPNHPNVSAITFPDDEALAQLYRSAWVFAYPSIYEGFGMAYVEALASGTAIVTSANVGANHILNGGEFGVIADDHHFAQAVVSLLANHQQRQSFEQKGLHRVQEFSWDAVANEYRKRYCMAIASF
jgi:glycosyltransferase involved in cell wall biosynthesis